MTTYTLTVSTDDLGLGVIDGARVTIERKRTQVTDIFGGQSLSKNTTATNVSGIATILLEPDDGSVYHELKVFDLAGILVYSKIFTMPPQAVAVTALPVQDIISSSAAQAVAASVTATAQASISTAQAVISTAQAVIATDKAVLTAGDRIQTGLDVIATNADAVQTAADVVTTVAARDSALAARDAALIQAGVYATEAAGRAAVANGVYFKVVGSGNVAAYEYVRVDASTSTLVATYPSKAYVDTKPAGALSKNLFDVSNVDVAIGYFPNNSTGALQANASYNCTGYIPVTSGQQYTVSNKHYWAWYTAAKVFISGTSPADTNKTQTAPALAAYMRASTTAATYWSTFQVEAGTTATSYEPYSVYLNIAGIKDKAITQAKLALNSVGQAQTSFLKTGKNLFNKNTVTVGYSLGNDGSPPTVSATYDYSDYIAVTPGANYVCSHTMRFTTFYDANYTFIAGGSGSNTTAIAVPLNVYFIRITITHSGLAGIQLEAGTTATTFEPYSYKILGDNSEPFLLDVSSISDNAITRAKVNFMPVGKNKFNKLTVTAGYYISNAGSLVANATYNLSAYIPVTVGATYVSNSSMRFTCYFNAGYAVVAGGSNSAISTFTVPAGVSFVRVAITATNNDAFQLEVGSTVTGYEAYGYYLDAGDSVPIYAAPVNSSTTNGWLNAAWATLGDSITAQATWQPYVVAKHGLLLTNYGIGGTKISGSIGDANAMCQDTRINAIATTNDLVTVMGGTNDWAQSVAMGTIASTDPLTFYGALNTMFSKLFTRFPTKRLMVFTTPYGEMPARLSDGSGWPDAITNTQGLKAADYAEAVRVAAKKWGVPCVDIFTDVGWNTINIATYLTNDGNYLHPNTAGSKRIAEVVIGALARLEKIA